MTSPSSVLSLLCILAALLLFIAGASTRWWATQQPYFHSFVSAGLAFLTVGVWILPLIFK